MSHWVVSNNAGILNNKKSKTLSEYPDVISPEEIKEILRISTSGVYHLLQAGTIKSIRVGKRYIIPKQSIRYL
ncbi:helix-turn-helix domain-containing protein [Ruminococcus difficilis]|uniref:Helix-turn-helix domain-containing protein n=1 Tax=Ruminococcus difficilis TaxID=2763069 RepID=A0A934WUT1_9FIRM|nr:helix-turn-helix domain-containing protein [Ruminococcus difficilis]MBK6090312.1 helix-turn-helix domain-containing protein [Ruminococcus difficilis]